jgi:hypothetical protein
VPLVVGEPLRGVTEPSRSCYAAGAESVRSSRSVRIASDSIGGAGFSKRPRRICSRAYWRKVNGLSESELTRRPNSYGTSWSELPTPSRDSFTIAASGVSGMGCILNTTLSEAGRGLMKQGRFDHRRQHECWCSLRKHIPANTSRLGTPLVGHHHNACPRDSKIGVAEMS